MNLLTSIFNVYVLPRSCVLFLFFFYFLWFFHLLCFIINNVCFSLESHSTIIHLCATYPYTAIDNQLANFHHKTAVWMRVQMCMCMEVCEHLLPCSPLVSRQILRCGLDSTQHILTLDLTFLVQQFSHFKIATDIIFHWWLTLLLLLIFQSRIFLLMSLLLSYHDDTSAFIRWAVHFFSPFGILIFHVAL